MKGYHYLILFGAVLIAFFGLSLWGFVHAYRDFGEQGPYPLATYTITSDLDRTKELIDSVCSIKQFPINPTVKRVEKLSNYLSIIIDPESDSIAFDVDLYSGYPLPDSITRLYLVRVTDKTRSVSDIGAKASDEEFLSKHIAKFEAELIDEIARPR